MCFLPCVSAPQCHVPTAASPVVLDSRSASLRTVRVWRLTLYVYERDAAHDGREFPPPWGTDTMPRDESCLRPPFSGSRLINDCYLDDCTTYGIAKALDGSTATAAAPGDSGVLNAPTSDVAYTVGLQVRNCFYRCVSPSLSGPCCPQRCAAHLQFDLGPSHQTLGFIKMYGYVQPTTYTKTVLSPLASLGVIPYVSVWLSSDLGAWKETGFRCAANYMVTHQQHTIIPCRSDAVSADPSKTRYVTIIRENTDSGVPLSLGVSYHFCSPRKVRLPSRIIAVTTNVCARAFLYPRIASCIAPNVPRQRCPNFWT